MVQFNLLPDVKLQYVKMRRTKYLMTVISVLVAGVALAAMLFSLFIVKVVQQNNLRDLNDDIKTASSELQSVDDLSKILTVQNQLSTLTQLHDDKPVTSRIFTYISQVTPAAASLDTLTIDYESSLITIGGVAPNLDTVSVYTDTLKATTFMTGGESDEKMRAFSNVVLSDFGRNDTGATFTITMIFDPKIFSAIEAVELSVPTTSTADSSNVFEAGA